MTVETWLAFAAASAVLLVVPGPFANAVGHALAASRAGLATAAVTNP